MRKRKHTRKKYMKVLFTGGGTGGHFYPIIAIAQKLHVALEKEGLSDDVKFFYMSDTPYDEAKLAQNRIEFLKVNTGKMRRYFSLKNITDAIKTPIAAFLMIFKLFVLYPDVVVGKGGYASFPALFAARILRIPVIIHESDSAPGKVNKWAGHFAQKIAVSYPYTVQYFPKKKTAVTGNPIRNEIMTPMRDGAYELLGLEPGVPTIVVLGGSQGAQIINDAVTGALPDLLDEFQVVHQVGIQNIRDIEKVLPVMLSGNKHAERYKPLGFLSAEQIRAASGIANIIISRAGSTIFEIALWGVPSIIIPITDSNGDHQLKNAYSYARAGCAEVIEEKNLTPFLLTTEIKRLIDDPARIQQMKDAMAQFADPGAAEKIARQIVNVLVEHNVKKPKTASESVSKPPVVPPTANVS